jgi:hypothetical protein
MVATQRGSAVIPYLQPVHLHPRPAPRYTYVYNLSYLNIYTMEAPRVYQRDLNDLNRGPEQEQNDALDLNDEEIEQEYIYQIPEGKALLPSQASLPLTL